MKLSIDSTIRMNNGVEIPRLGLGTWQAEKGEALQAVLWALEAGYRHIDTATVYGNEDEVGTAVAQSGIARKDLFIVTKVWNDDQGIDKALKAFDTSLKRLKMDYVDMYLVHWPVKGLRGETWKALTKIYEEGKARAIGVSNFTIRHLNELLPGTAVVPAANQIEVSPFLTRTALVQFCQAKGMVVEAYSPLSRGKKLEDVRLAELAGKYGKTPAQMAIRWALQHDLVVIPKSTHQERIKQNADVFDFEISAADMKAMDGLNEDYWTINPSFNPESSTRWE